MSLIPSTKGLRNLSYRNTKEKSNKKANANLNYLFDRLLQRLQGRLHSNFRGTPAPFEEHPRLLGVPGLPGHPADLPPPRRCMGIARK